MKEECKKTKGKSTVSKSSETSKKCAGSKNNGGQAMQAKSSKAGSQNNKMEK